jgi:hypothetical protein
VLQADFLNVVQAKVGLTVTADAFAIPDGEKQSYFALMEVLGDILCGKLWRAPGDMHYPAADAKERTLIFETNLAFASELLPLFHMYRATEPQAPRPALPLSSAIEELFRNMTLSTFSDGSLLGPQLYDSGVEKIYFYNVYHYNWERLVLAYGVAITLTFFAVIAGCYTILRTGASFTNKFSTILRVSRNEGLDLLITPADRVGEEPLPKHIGKERLSIFGRAGEGESELQSLKSSCH